MQERVNYRRPSHGGFKAMLGLETYVKGCGLEPLLIELVKLRASQINGCAFCLDMHARYARKAGETEQRLYTASAWREAPFFTPRERAALSWTEALTLISETQASDDVYEDVRAHFSEEELLDLTFAIVTINGWNRLAIGFRTPIKQRETTSVAPPQPAPGDR